MTFTTPCFVRVEDPAERKKLIEWLEWIGHDVCICCHFEGHSTLYCDPILKSKFDVHGFPDKEDEIGFTIEKLKRENAMKDYPSYDCGTSVELFRALAAMNDENDRDQWFTDGERWGLCKDEYLAVQAADWYIAEDDDMLDMYANNCRKATAEEIVEYFKKRDKCKR